MLCSASSAHTTEPGPLFSPTSLSLQCPLWRHDQASQAANFTARGWAESTKALSSTRDLQRKPQVLQEAVLVTQLYQMNQHTTAHTKCSSVARGSAGVVSDPTGGCSARAAIPREQPNGGLSVLKLFPILLSLESTSSALWPAWRGATPAGRAALGSALHVRGAGNWRCGRGHWDVLGGTFSGTLGWPALPGAPVFRDPLWKPLRKKGCRFGGAEKDSMVWGCCPVTTCRPGF